jgi:DNA repair photolyase
MTPEREYGMAETFAQPAETTVREVVCKTILNRSSLGGYSLNAYTGCAHNCAYCYARFMQRFHPHDEPWGEFVDVKVNAVETLVRQLRRAPPDEVFVSSACDGWQPIEAERRLTRRCCQLLLKRGFPVNVLTKSALVIRDFDVFRGRDVRLGVTLTTLDDAMRALWEPGASSVAERIAVLEAAQKDGLRTSIMFGPLLPGLSDSQNALDGMFQKAAELGVDRVWTDALNLRPRVWPALQRLLQTRFPGLLSDYRQILFDASVRADYLAGLRDRIRLASCRAGLKCGRAASQCELPLDRR